MPSGYGSAVSSRWRRLLPLLALPLLAAGCQDDGPAIARGPLTPGLPAPAERTDGWPAETPGPAHDVAVPRGTLDSAEVDVVSGVTSVTVRAADLGPDLVRASTPDGSQVAPALDVDGGSVRVCTSSRPAGPGRRR